MTAIKKTRVLIVDDHPTNIKVLSDLLVNYGFEVLIAKDGKNALQKLQRILPDIILLDVLMPEMDGFETCRRLKASTITQTIPVIFMTALSDPVDKIKGLTLGAVDYITKPFQHEEVIARINVHLRLRSLTKQLEEQNTLLQEEIRSRELVELALRLSEEKFSKAFRSNPGAMTISTLDDSRFIEVNQSFCRIMGYAPEEVFGKTVTDLNLWVNLDDRDRFNQLLETSSAMHNQEFQFYNRAGEIRFMLVSAEVIQIGDRTCVLAMTQDITTCKQAAAAMQQAKEAADMANYAKSTFLTNISHELRTPLNVILGYTQLLSLDPSLHPKHLDDLDIINRSGEHLLNLINDVLDLSKIEAGKVTLNNVCFDLYGLLQNLEEMFQLQASAKNLLLKVECTPNVPYYVRADETKLRQVLTNLLNNAIKFTPEGSVTLRVTVEPTDLVIAEPGEQLDLLNPQVVLLFEIEDTGFGISETDLNTIFEPFVQTEMGRRLKQGSGLGLPISQKFVQLMGGEITVSSGLGQGAVFRFGILVHPLTTLQLPEQTQQFYLFKLAPEQPSYRILVVDDGKVNSQLLTKMLEMVGFDVQEAANGQEAIALWETWHPHLILMEMRMPVIDGYEATRRIKATLEGQQTPIIAVTASTFDEERAIILAAGCDDFISKPIKRNILFAKIAEHLGVQYVQERSPV